MERLSSLSQEATQRQQLPWRPRHSIILLNALLMTFLWI